MRMKLVALLAAVTLAAEGYVAGQAGPRGGDDSTSLPGFSQVASLT